MYLVVFWYLPKRLLVSDVIRNRSVMEVDIDAPIDNQTMLVEDTNEKLYQKKETFARQSVKRQSKDLYNEKKVRTMSAVQ